MRTLRTWAFAALLLIVFGNIAAAAPPAGYYRQPALHKDTLVFVSEGDLWKVSLNAGVATRLTSHPGEEGHPAISPDGQTLAFTAQYEGPAEVYTMPLDGGRPQRRTFDGATIEFVGWTPDGKLLFATDRHATLPARQLVTLDLARKDTQRTLVPLAQAADGCYDSTGKTLFFTRFPFQGSHTKRYQGGTAQNLWKFSEGADEAVPLTAGYAGTSKNPLYWNGRIYFASDRDATMNLWSMSPDGHDLKQHTRHAGWDLASPCLSEGKIVYQLGADLRLYDIAADNDRLVSITLASDFDHDREHWVKKPLEYLTSAHLSPDGDRVVLTARGRVFVAPQRQGRLVEATRKEGVRYRDARFMPDGKDLLALSDESGEVELWQLPANGVGDPQQLTRDGDVLRLEGVPSPNGKWIAHRDKNQRLFLYDVAQKKNRLLEQSNFDQLTDLAWSPDSKWLAYVSEADNLFKQIKLYGIEDGKITAVTSDRRDSSSPAWSPDGQWLYLLSDRNLKTVVEEPWGSYQPEPFLDKKTKIYHLALTEDQRSPWAPADELSPDDKADAAKPEQGGKKNGRVAGAAARKGSADSPDMPKDKDKDKDKDKADKKDKEKEKEKPAAPVVVKIDLDGIQSRLIEVPVPAGNYTNLSLNDTTLFWLSTAAGEKKGSLSAAKIARDNVEVKTVTGDVKDYELSADGEKLLIQKEEDLYIIDAEADTAKLEKKDVDLDNWRLSVQPREEWKQMFVEAWRLERDYFYDRGMHGNDWAAIRKKYEPLVQRVNSRDELADLIAQMVSELSALHIFVRGGEMRKGPDDVQPASLGAELTRDQAAGGYRVAHIYQSDPDEPDQVAPLARPSVRVKQGDVIELINGMPVLSVPDVGLLLRHKAGRQVLLRVQPAGGGAARDVIVTPLSPEDAASFRYREWEYTRRLAVEEQGKGDIGYVHLRAMGGENYTEWARNFFPVFTRKGLIIDMRNNEGGNIDSWILNRLLRKAWFHWTQRVGQPPSWNMQYAFRGHLVVLCNEMTASDGEAFTEGFKRLGLGKVIGMRTWGGEIWLSGENFLVDKGIATAAEFGVYGPEGRWLIEGHGVDPDMVVDNLPHATFKGEDAQLKAAITHLQKMIKEKPVEVPPVPKYPNKAFKSKP
jgi:tricorn protease